MTAIRHKLHAQTHTKFMIAKNWCLYVQGVKHRNHLPSLRHSAHWIRQTEEESKQERKRANTRERERARERKRARGKKDDSFGTATTWVDLLLEGASASPLKRTSGFKLRRLSTSVLNRAAPPTGSFSRASMLYTSLKWTMDSCLEVCCRLSSLQFSCWCSKGTYKSTQTKRLSTLLCLEKEIYRLCWCLSETGLVRDRCFSSWPPLRLDSVPAPSFPPSFLFVRHAAFACSYARTAKQLVLLLNDRSYPSLSCGSVFKGRM